MSNFNQYRRAATVPNGNPFTWHSNTDGLNGVGLLEPGELGGVLPWSGHQFQLVKMDSGATSATATGVPAAGQVAFWKDRTQYLVTNNPLQADVSLIPANTVTKDARNSVAGLIEMAVVAGENFFVHQKGSTGVSGKDSGAGVKSSSSPNPGDVFVAATGTGADATSVAAGTAPTAQEIGVVVSPTASGGKFPAVLTIQFID